MMHLAAAAQTAGQQPFVSLDVPFWTWPVLGAALTVLLVADLLLVHRTPHDVKFRNAAIESAVWITIGVGFTGLLAWAYGGQAATEYITGFLIEKSLSIDNVFVWSVIFTYFGVPGMYQFRVLFWGIFGALVLRGLFIFTGIALLERFDFVLYIFGAFLLYTAVKLARHSGGEVHPESNVALKLIRRVVPISTSYDGQKLFTRSTGRLIATPLFAVLILIETTDVLFAFDSIPAILAVSREPFIVFSANAFAILGLRALYFCLAGLAGKFRYLNQGLGVILAFVGVKMLIVEWYHVPTWASLGLIAVVLAVTITLSLRADKRARGQGQAASVTPTPPDVMTDAPISRGPEDEGRPPSL
ncbi:MAG: TerC family protein [Actinomycetota bacterium]